LKTLKCAYENPKTAAENVVRCSSHAFNYRWAPRENPLSYIHASICGRYQGCDLRWSPSLDWLCNPPHAIQSLGPDALQCVHRVQLVTTCAGWTVMYMFSVMYSYRVCGFWPYPFYALFKRLYHHVLFYAIMIAIYMTIALGYRLGVLAWTSPFIQSEHLGHLHFTP
jgi:hypothetical protein